MKLAKGILLSLVAFSFVGCPVRSIFPLFHASDQRFDPALVGNWVYKEDTLRVTAVKNRYEVVSRVGRDGTRPRYHTYDVRLGKLGHAFFLDSYQYIREDAQDHMLPAHQFHQMWLRGDTLELAHFDGDWLRRMIDSTHLAVTHVRRDNEIILTAPTEELQSLLTRFADDPNAFAKTTYVRSR